MQNGKSCERSLNLSKTVKTVIAIVLVVILGVGLYFLITNTLNATKQRSFSDFNDLIEANVDADRDPNAEAPIKMVRIEGYAIYGYTDANQRTYAYWTYGPSFYEGYDPDEQSNLPCKVGGTWRRDLFQRSQRGRGVRAMPSSISVSWSSSALRCTSSCVR